MRIADLSGMCQRNGVNGHTEMHTHKKWRKTKRLIVLKNYAFVTFVDVTIESPKRNRFFFGVKWQENFVLLGNFFILKKAGQRRREGRETTNEKNNTVTSSFANTHSSSHTHTKRLHAQGISKHKSERDRAISTWNSLAALVCVWERGQ